MFTSYSISCVFGLPCDAHTHCDVGVGAERDTFLAGLAKDVVHADEEVVALRMDVHHISHACSKAACRKADASVKPLEGFPVGAQSALGPREVAVDACGADESEGHLAVDRQCVFASGGDCGADACRPAL